MSTSTELDELIPHVSVVQNLSLELCNITKENAFASIKSFVDSKIKDTIQYINKRIQDKINSDPLSTYVLIKNSDIFNLWEPKLTPEELFKYNQYYRCINRGNYAKIEYKTYKYGDQFAQTKNNMVKSVLEEAFKLYHKQGYRTQWCWYYSGSTESDCFDIIWEINKN